MSVSAPHAWPPTSAEILKDAEGWLDYWIGDEKAKRKLEAPISDIDILQLADREMQRLDDENDHGAAIIMRALASRLRDLIRERAKP